MSSFEFNKVIGALLLAVLTMVVIGKLGDNLVSTGGGHGGDSHGAEKAVVASKAAKPKKPEPLQPIVGMLASADATAGEKVFKKCAACHKVAKDGKNGIGPNLWNIVGAKRGAVDGFGYSDALKSKEGSWTYESLNAFLAKPKGYVPGTKMSFAGLKKVQDRANVVAYLRNAADTPAPLPNEAEIGTVMEAYEAAKKALAEATEAVAETATEAVQEAKQAVAAATSAAAEPKMNIAAMLASADVDKGKRAFNKCKACHTVDKGGKNAIGPNLWGVVNRAPAAVDGFKYSNALAGMTDKPWTYENLNAFLLKPRTYAKGTKMSFAGLKKDSERANVIAYLRSLSDSPAPLK
ncbi:MAG: c-type cytochrome [Alphaproteobacteria bacterium]